MGIGEGVGDGVGVGVLVAVAVGIGVGVGVDVATVGKGVPVKAGVPETERVVRVEVRSAVPSPCLFSVGSVRTFLVPTALTAALRGWSDPDA